MVYIDKQVNELKERLIKINRVSKTAKGGRVFSFTALTVVGNGNGKVGFGYGKSREVPSAIQKSMGKARNNMINVTLKKYTLQHTIYGKYVGTNVFIKPAVSGTGILAGSTIRAILEVAGIKDALTKIFGSTNSINVVQATINALKNMKCPKFIAYKRGKSIKDIFG
ncbi:MAG: 30S ribosomal protein S5 [Enterobacterales bacterium]